MGKVEQTYYLALGVTAADALHITYVIRVHAYKQVILVLVTARKLTGAVTVTAYAVLCQFAACRRIDGVAQLLRTGSSRCYVPVIFLSCLGNQVFHYVFCHRRTADVAMTDEEYPFHYFWDKIVTISYRNYK